MKMMENLSMKGGDDKKEEEGGKRPSQTNPQLY